MIEEYIIEAVDPPDWGTIGGGIHAYNVELAGPENGQQLCFMLKSPDGEPAGGLIAQTHWDWLYVDLMWVREDLRGCGWGSRLLEMVEEKARQLGAKNAYLDTFSFQAPGFYKKHGYRVFGTLEGFPAGHKRFYLTKAL